MEKILFTGANGFLGSNILPLLKSKYYIDTLGIGNQATYNINLAQAIPNFNVRYKLVLHAAGKAHTIPKNKEEINEIFDINVKGTHHICKALENSCIPQTFIFISSVSVYGCEEGYLITEDHPLNGKSPYAESKILAEQYLTQWCKQNSVKLIILRPSLLAGKNPPGNLGAMINAIRKGYFLTIGGGKTKKSIAMAEDIARLIPLCENKEGVYNLCDNYHPSIKELSHLIAKQLGKKDPLDIPYLLAKSSAKIGDLLGGNSIFNTKRLEKLITSLTFSNEKLKKEFNFQPLDVLSNFIIK